MNFDEFRLGSRAGERPPPSLSAPLRGLWADACDDWESAHVVVQDDEGPEAARVHAYLHRKEGDHSNALYWYRRAGQPEFHGTLQEEWEQLVRQFLEMVE